MRLRAPGARESHNGAADPQVHGSSPPPKGRAAGREVNVELTVAAIPVYFGSIGAEYAWLRRHAAERGATPGDYEWRDTVASLTMGVGSLVAPMVAQKLLGSRDPGSRPLCEGPTRHRCGRYRHRNDRRRRIAIRGERRRDRPGSRDRHGVGA